MSGERDFAYWLKAGFAFTLPLFALGVLLVIAAFMFSSALREAAPTAAPAAAPMAVPVVE